MDLNPLVQSHDLHKSSYDIVKETPVSIITKVENSNIAYLFLFLLSSNSLDNISLKSFNMVGNM